MKTKIDEGVEAHVVDVCASNGDMVAMLCHRFRKEDGVLYFYNSDDAVIAEFENFSYWIYRGESK